MPVRPKNISRKDFIRNSAVAMAAIPLNIPCLTSLAASSQPALTSFSTEDKFSISIFSKHLQWLDYKEMARLTAKMGFDGIDLTVRGGGHILPQNVTRDLPKAVEIIRDAGLEIYTITTDIRTADDKYAHDVLRTAGQLGIRNYRMGWYNYDNSIDILTNIDVFKKRFAALADVNERYQIHGDYENHTGLFGGPLWDLWLALKDLDPQWIGCQFDIRHATVDGAEAWPTNLKLLQNYIGSLTIKDFHWKKEGQKWEVADVPLGQGMIDFTKYFKILKELGVRKPLSVHYEYPLGGAESGKNTLSISQEEAISRIEADIRILRSWLST